MLTVRSTSYILIVTLLALLLGCDPVYYVRRTSEALPKVQDLQCVENAIKTVQLVTFKDRDTYRDVQYFRYIFNDLPEGKNLGVVQIRGTNYTNELFAHWKSEADSVRQQVEPVLLLIDAAVRDVCKIKFETKQSG